MTFKSPSLQKIILVFYFSLYLIVALSMVYVQPFGNPPDEYNRYLIPKYIFEHGSLPTGLEEETRIGGYGFSYALQPILPYIFQSLAMRFVALFTTSENALFYTARLVNLFFGLLMAYFVLLLSRKWFTDKRLAWLFCFLVTFLPQSIFIHTYVNTDSCCMLSIAIMLYGLTRGTKDSFSPSSCILVSIGIILCALSYYNAYGYILSCILLFTAYFLSFHQHKLCFDGKTFLKKGLFISAIVLLGIGWWFLRSFFLYNGDILGLRTRDALSALYAVPEFRPENRATYQNQGLSLWAMLTTSDFLVLTQNSFISAFGPMTITTSVWVYRFYKLLFAIGIFAAVVTAIISTIISPRKFSQMPPFKTRPIYRIFFHANMIFCIFMPCALSVYYSYTYDYQPQGRYVLPILIPLCYYCVWGISNLETIASSIKKPMKSQSAGRLLTGLCIAICILIVISLLVTIYVYAFPCYIQNPIP